MKITPGKLKKALIQLRQDTLTLGPRPEDNDEVRIAINTLIAPKNRKTLATLAGILNDLWGDQ